MTQVCEATDANLAALAQEGTLGQNLKTIQTLAEAPANTVMEPKLDGWRIHAQVTDDGVHLYSRKGIRYDGAIPKVAEELRAHFPAGTWLDAEAVSLVIDEKGRVDDWGVTQSVMSSGSLHPDHEKVTLVVFDLLAHRGIDARPLPYEARRRLLERAFEGTDFDAVQLSATMEPTEANHEATLAQGFEGTVVKVRSAPYASGKRGVGWFRLKPQASVDVVAMGYKPGENGFTGLVGAVVFGQYDATGTLVERGRCSGLTMRERKRISAPDGSLREDYHGRVFEMKHHGFMKGGFRHPQWKRWRPDRSPESVEFHND